MNLHGMELVRPIENGISIGRYVAVCKQSPFVGDGSPRILWMDDEGHRIHETPENINFQYGMIGFDFDATIADTNELHQFGWDTTCRKAGMNGEPSDLVALKKLVYTWEHNVTLSTQQMLRRISSGFGVNGKALESAAQTELNKLVDFSNQLLLSENSTAISPSDRDDVDYSIRGVLLSNYKEQVVHDMVHEHPDQINSMAPLIPGVVDFIRRIPPDLQVFVATSANASKSVLSVLWAHSLLGSDGEYLHDRFAPSMVYGEHELPGYKGDFLYSLHAAIKRNQTSGYRMRVDDILYVGDDYKYDVESRRDYSCVVINPNKPIQKAPLLFATTSFADLLHQAKSGNQSDHVLKRLALTLQ